MSELAKDKIILALDVDTLQDAEKLVDELKDYVGYFKIGLPLIVNYGFEAFRVIENLGAKCYFDCKFHDIPYAVDKACASLVRNGIDLFNVHIQGGSKMVSSAVKSARQAAKELGVEPPKILGVTLLSSFGQKTLTTELCVKEGIENYVLQLAHVAKDCGLNGVVASAEEAKRIRKEMGDDFIILCPATRPVWSVVNDQVRVDTPREAILSGVDYMVIGRPITEAEDHISAAKMIIDEIENALNEKAEIL